MSQSLKIWTFIKRSWKFSDSEKRRLAKIGKEKDKITISQRLNLLESKG